MLGPILSVHRFEWQESEEVLPFKAYAANDRCGRLAGIASTTGFGAEQPPAGQFVDEGQLPLLATQRVAHALSTLPQTQLRAALILASKRSIICLLALTGACSALILATVAH